MKEVTGTTGKTNLVRLEGLIGSTLALGTSGELSEVTVVVALPVLESDTLINMSITLQPTSYGRRPWTLQSRPWG